MRRSSLPSQLTSKMLSVRPTTRVRKPAVGKVASMPRPRVAKLPSLPKVPKLPKAGGMKRGGTVR